MKAEARKRELDRRRERERDSPFIYSTNVGDTCESVKFVSSKAQLHFSKTEQSNNN